MRTKEEIIKRKEWVLKALDEEENQGEIRQIQLYAQLDLLKWLECGTSDEQETIENLLKVQYALADNLNKQTTCLQEIKAIAECCMTKDVCYECKYSDDCHIEDAEIPTYDICKLLIQKITKVEEE